MKNPTPGKNPFELASWVSKMPPLMREIYLAMTQNFTNFSGRSTVGQFWRFFIFAACYVAALLYIADTMTHTVTVFLGLLLLGWLYIAVPLAAISFRRMHDTGRSGIFALIPQIALFYGIGEFAVGITPNLIIWAIIGGFCLISFVLLSLPSQKEDNRYGPYSGREP